MQDLPQCGTTLAATDAVLTVQALVATEPAPDAVITAASKAAAAAVMSRFLEASGLQALLKVRSFAPVLDSLELMSHALSHEIAVLLFRYQVWQPVSAAASA